MLGRMFGLGMPELLVILVLLTVLFGASKLPQLGDGLGKAIRGFKKAVEGVDEKPKAPLAAEKPVADAEAQPAVGSTASKP
jgi:sec-independent protein translocase protein TatA